MTQTSTTVKVTYTGDGSTTAFPTTFRFLQNSHVKVIERTISSGAESTLTEGTEYTLTGKGEASGGTVTAATAPASSVQWIVKRDAPLTQETSFPLGGDFPSTSVEDALDLLTQIMQQHGEELDRALQFSETSADKDKAFPDLVADRLVYVDSDGELSLVTLGSLSTAIDTVFTALASGDFLKYDGTNWINRTGAEVASDIGALLAASNLSDLADAATARTNMGLAIGTDVLAPAGSGDELTGELEDAYSIAMFNHAL